MTINDNGDKQQAGPTAGVAAIEVSKRYFFPGIHHFENFAIFMAREDVRYCFSSMEVTRRRNQSAEFV